MQGIRKIKEVVELMAAVQSEIMGDRLAVLELLIALPKCMVGECQEPATWQRYVPSQPTHHPQEEFNGEVIHYAYDEHHSGVLVEACDTHRAGVEQVHKIEMLEHCYATMLRRLTVRARGWQT